jgi:hypothetical protein
MLSNNVNFPRSYTQPEEDGTKQHHKITSSKAKTTQKNARRQSIRSDNEIANSNLIPETSSHLPEQKGPNSPSASESPPNGGYSPAHAHGTSQVPIAGALFVATCLGTPVIALTGLKLGMFAAMGGGIMGFATGKMFAEHE